MLSFRAFSRALPRSTLFTRSIATTSLSRPLRASPARLQSAFKLASKPTYAAFSTSGPRFQSAGQVDPELAAKFQDELALEKESAESEKVPESVQAFLDNKVFDIKDTPGQEEVILTRKFGDETIRVSFTIADVRSLDGENDDMYNEDSSLGDEFLDSSSQQKSNPERAPPDPAALDQGENPPSYNARVNVVIDKPGKGAMLIDTIAEDGVIQIAQVSYFANADLAIANGAEKDWTRNSQYAGPPFSNLDEGLQDLLERYLDERGVDSSLAAFVPDYIDYKEQREYMRWLENLKNFIES